MKQVFLALGLMVSALAQSPTVVVSSTTKLATTEYPYFVAVFTFSENVEGLQPSEVIVTNGACRDVYVKRKKTTGEIQSNIWTAYIVMDSEGECTVTIPAGAAYALDDSATNDASNTLSMTWTDDLPGVYTPPIGIPEPSFGIEQNAKTIYGVGSGATYDYSDDSPTGAIPYRLTAGNDPYTYYVDPEDPASTDTGNPHGTVAVPRKTFPTSYAPATMANGDVIPRTRLKAGDVVLVAPTTNGVLWYFGFNSGWDGSTTMRDSIGIGTASAPVFVMGTDPENRSRILTSRGVKQDAPNTEYVLWDNMFFDCGNHNVQWPYNWDGGFPPSNPYEENNDNDIWPLTVTSRSNHVAIRNCEFGGVKFYDFRYFNVKGKAVTFEHGDGNIGVDLSNIVLYQCVVGPTSIGASIDDPTANADGSWTGGYPPEYVGITYPWREDSGLIGFKVGNATHNIWALECTFDRNADSSQVGETSTGPSQSYPPLRTFFGRSTFLGDQENNLDFKGGLYSVVSENLMGHVRRAKKTSDALPYEEGVNTPIAGGGGGEIIRYNNEGQNGFNWVLNNIFVDGTQAVSSTTDSWTYDDPNTWRPRYTVGNLFVNLLRDSIFFPLFHGNMTDGPKGERGSNGDGYALLLTKGNDIWFVNNTIDTSNRGISGFNVGDSYIFNNISVNRPYDTDVDGFEDEYFDLFWATQSSLEPPGGYEVVLAPNIVWPTAKTDGLFEATTPIELDPDFVDDAAVDIADRDYRLNTGSPAIDDGIDAGAELSARYKAQFGGTIVWTDINGVARGDNGAWDIGAYEYDSGNPPANVAPFNSTPPSITGSTVVGGTMSLSTGTWGGTPSPSYAYQWIRCDSTGGNPADISGATSITYTTTAPDIGGTIRVRVTGTNSEGSASATSSQTPAITAVPVDPVPATGTATMENLIIGP